MCRIFGHMNMQESALSQTRNVCLLPQRTIFDLQYTKMSSVTEDEVKESALEALIALIYQWWCSYRLIEQCFHPMHRQCIQIQATKFIMNLYKSNSLVDSMREFFSTCRPGYVLLHQNWWKQVIALERNLISVSLNVQFVIDVSDIWSKACSW